MKTLLKLLIIITLASTKMVYASDAISFETYQLAINSESSDSILKDGDLLLEILKNENSDLSIAKSFNKFISGKGLKFTFSNKVKNKIQETKIIENKLNQLPLSTKTAIELRTAFLQYRKSQLIYYKIFVDDLNNTQAGSRINAEKKVNDEIYFKKFDIFHSKYIKLYNAKNSN